MSRLFEAVTVDGDDVKANIPRKGWRKLVSINGVGVDRIKALAQEASPENWDTELNALLPQVMAMTDTPLGPKVTVVAQDVSEAEETIEIPYKAIDKKVAAEALQKNFEGIVALGKAAGLTVTEINVAFALCMKEFEEASNMGEMDMQDMMGNMMGAMMDRMGQLGGGEGSNCQTQ